MDEAYVGKGYWCDRSIPAAHRTAGPIGGGPVPKVQHDQWPLDDLVVAAAGAGAGTVDQGGITRLTVKGRGTRLAHWNAGNPAAMVRTDYEVSSSGSTVPRFAAPWLDVTVPATAHNATALRGTFRHWVDSILAGDAADDLTLAVYEALANAAEHAFTAHSAPGSIWLHAVVADGQITITVTDNGSWRRPTNSGGYRGRGLPLIHRLTSEAHVAPSPYGTTVYLRRRLHAEEYEKSA